MIEIEKKEDRTIFKAEKENLDFVKKLIKEEDLEYGKYNDLIKTSDINIGLEFEFYLNKDTNMEKLFSSLLSYGTDLMYCPTEFNIQDKPLDVWTIERDGTLVNPLKMGLEIVSPKLDLIEAPFYIKSLLQIIKQYGHTDKTCAFHFHISSINEKIQDINPAKLMLFLDSNKTLGTWKYRSEFNKEILDIFNQSTIDDFNNNFKEISRFYTVVSRSRYGIKNHLEVRAIGGNNYEFKEELIINDFKSFVESYFIACSPEIEKNKFIELSSEFENRGGKKNPIAFKDLLNHAKELVDFENLNVYDKRDMLETAIYNFEDKNYFVPTKALLKEIDDFFENEIKKNNNTCAVNTYDIGVLR